MKAVCWMGTSKIEVHTVPDPTLLNPHDAILKITRTAICGSDLHLYDGFIPTMEEGEILGHEFVAKSIRTISFPTESVSTRLLRCIRYGATRKSG